VGDCEVSFLQEITEETKIPESDLCSLSYLPFNLKDVTGVCVVSTAIFAMLTRRQLLQTTGQGFGALAFASLQAGETSHRSQVVAPKAKRVMQLFMGGAASHIDLLITNRRSSSITARSRTSARRWRRFKTDWGPWKKPVWDFKPYGQSGRMLSEAVAPLGACADDMAFVHNMVGKTGVHSQGTLLQATGFNLPGFPGMGCWVSYALGSLSDNLPTFVVLPDHRGFASNGPKNWDSAFLPSQHAGTIIYPGAETPISDLFPHKSGRYISARSDRAGFELLEQLNRKHMQQREEDSRLDSRIRATNSPRRCSSPRRRRSTSRRSPMR
jgi:hypothetical protein